MLDLFCCCFSLDNNYRFLTDDEQTLVILQWSYFLKNNWKKKKLNSKWHTFLSVINIYSSQMCKD